MTRARRLSIDRIIVDAGAMAPNDVERFRGELTRELGRLLAADAAPDIPGADRARIAVNGEHAAGERVDGAGIAGAIVQALSRP